MVKLVRLLTLLMTMILGVVSYCGIFEPLTYKNEVASFAAQGIGQDLFNLFLIVPLCIIVIFLLKKDSIKVLLYHSGIVFYILYSFVIYSFSVHFNYLFLWYCSLLGLSIYLFILDLSLLLKKDFMFECRGRIRILIVAFLSIVVFTFYMLWLREIVPAILTHTMPKSVLDYNLPVNAVHVLDIAFVLPGMLMSAIFFMKKNRWGDILAPIVLVFIILMALALATMVVVLKQKQIEDNILIALVFIVLAFFSFLILARLLKNLKKTDPIRLNV